MMKNKKMIISGVVVSVLLVTGGTIVYQKIGDNQQIEVKPVYEISTSWWGDSQQSSGNITSHLTQEIKVPTNQLIKEVHVQEGQQVAINDPLLTYDTTLTELELEMEKLNAESITLKIKMLQKELEKLKAMKPINSPTTVSLLTSSQVQVTRLNATPPKMEMKSLLQLDDQTPLEANAEGVIELNVLPDTILMKSFLYKLKGLDELGETIITEPIHVKVLIQLPSQKVLTMTLDGATIEVAPEFEQQSLTEYFNLQFEDQPQEWLELNAQTELKANDQGIYELRVLPDTVLMKSFLYKLKGLDEAGQTSISDPMSVKLYIKYPDGSVVVQYLEGDHLEIPDEFDQQTLREYFDLDNSDEDLEEEPFEPELPEEGYTKEELAQLIQEKSGQIINLELDYKEALLKVKKIEKELVNATVLSTVNGIVKTVGDPDVDANGEPFMIVSSDNGLYLKGTIDEYQLGSVQVGDTVEVTSWETGGVYTATITDIFPYPVSSEESGFRNPNVSYYPFTAYLEEDESLKNNMFVSFTIQSSMDLSEGLYLDMAYLKEEKGQKVVYKANENKRLEKQPLTTGKIIYGQYIEIISGLTSEDQVAFPYGKNVKEGISIK